MENAHLKTLYLNPDSQDFLALISTKKSQTTPLALRLAVGALKRLQSCKQRTLNKALLP